MSGDGLAAPSTGRYPVRARITESNENSRESRRRTKVRYAWFSLVGGSTALVDVGVLDLLLLISPTRSPEVLVVYSVVALVVTNANS